MVMSRRTSAHVHSVFEVNFSRVAKIREARKAEYEAAGAKLTFLSFISGRSSTRFAPCPSSTHRSTATTSSSTRTVNIGVAVALDWGLIVPVIKKADEKNLLGLSRAVADLAARARAKQLKPDEVAGGTFTITNPGVFGALFGMPIINQPQVAILGVGDIEKRAVVIDDAIAIRPMGYLPRLRPPADRRGGRRRVHVAPEAHPGELAADGRRGRNPAPTAVGRGRWTRAAPSR